VVGPDVRADGRERCIVDGFPSYVPAACHVTLLAQPGTARAFQGRKDAHVDCIHVHAVAVEIGEHRL